MLHGGAGNDDITDGDGGNNILDGGAGNDHLRFAEPGNSTILGGTGDDFICTAFSAFPDQPDRAVDGTTLIVGGPGDDALYGGAGDDVYQFAQGDGFDLMADAAGVDRVRFAPGIGVDDVTFAKDDINLVIKVDDPANPGAAQGMYVLEWFGDDPNRNIEFFEFADGTVLDRAQATHLAFSVRGTAGQDSITTYGPVWKVEVLGGDDFVDYLPEVPMYVNGGAGNDTLFGAQTPLNAQATVVGGLGNDSIAGMSGRDTYLFDRGDGNDTMSHMLGPRVPDRLVFGAGIGLTDVAFAREKFDLVMRIGGVDGAPPDSIRLVEWYYPGRMFLGSLEFADGRSLSTAQFSDLGNFILGTDGNDSIVQADYTRFIDGGAGNDTLDGGAKVPVLRGGDGNDLLRFNCVSNNTIMGGSGNDTVTCVGGSASGTAQLTGGTGDDTLTGNPGATTYIFNRGDGRDTIVDTGETTVVDRLVFGAGIRQADLAFSRIGNDLVLTIDGAGAAPAGDAITVTGWFQAATKMIEQLQFADGTVLTAAQVSGMVYGTAGADTLTAAPDQYLLAGLAGDDKLAAGTVGVLLAGGAGNDTLTGGAAADFLHGGKGDDVLAAGTRDIVGFNGGDGADILKAVGSGATLSLGAGIDLAQLTLAHAGADLVLALGGGDSVTLKDWYAATQPAQGVARLQTIDAGGSHLFDFHAAVMAFDAAHGPGSGVWAIEAQLAAAAQGGAANTALGGVLAVDIAAHGTVTSLSPVYDTIRSGVFGLDPQLM